MKIVFNNEFISFIKLELSKKGDLIDFCYILINIMKYCKYVTYLYLSSLFHYLFYSFVFIIVLFSFVIIK